MSDRSVSDVLGEPPPHPGSPAESVIDTLITELHRYQVYNQGRPYALIVHPETRYMLLRDPETCLEFFSWRPHEQLLGFPLHVSIAVPEGSVFLVPQLDDFNAEASALAMLRQSHLESVRRYLAGGYVPPEPEPTEWKPDPNRELGGEPAREVDIVDEIDRLVDEQLQQEKSGYDHNINQTKCPYCGDDWHWLPITKNMRMMRQHLGYVPPNYQYSEDQSPLWCKGAKGHK